MVLDSLVETREAMITEMLEEAGAASAAWIEAEEVKEAQTLSVEARFFKLMRDPVLYCSRTTFFSRVSLKRARFTPTR